MPTLDADMLQIQHGERGQLGGRNRPALSYQFRHGLSYFPHTARKSVRGKEIGFQPPWYEAGALITNLSQKCKFCRVTPADLVCSTQLERELSLR